MNKKIYIAILLGIVTIFILYRLDKMTNTPNDIPINNTPYKVVPITPDPILKNNPIGTSVQDIWCKTHDCKG